MVDAVLSPLAKTDMQEIGDYISQSLHNPSAAQQLIRRFREAITSLRSFPEMGTPLLSEQSERLPYRYLICGSYMIFYHFEANSVYVDRVLYGRRDYMALLFGSTIGEEE